MNTILPPTITRRSQASTLRTTHAGKATRAAHAPKAHSSSAVPSPASRDATGPPPTDAEPRIGSQAPQTSTTQALLRNRDSGFNLRVEVTSRPTGRSQITGNTSAQPDRASQANSPDQRPSPRQHGNGTDARGQPLPTMGRWDLWRSSTDTTKRNRPERLAQAGPGKPA